MAKEIERKFLVKDFQYRCLAGPVYCQQGYLSLTRERIVKVRIVDERALLIVKGITTGISRSEFEYEIPLEDARRMMDELCEKPLLRSQLYRING